MTGQLEIDYIFFKDKFVREISIIDFTKNTQCMKILLSELTSTSCPAKLNQNETILSLSFDFADSFILTNEKLVKCIKNEFAKGVRDVQLSIKKNGFLQFLRDYPVYSFVIDKDLFLDALELAEENAISRKIFKPEHFIEIVDIRVIG